MRGKGFGVRREDRCEDYLYNERRRTEHEVL